MIPTIIDNKIFTDHRGSLSKIFEASKFSEIENFKLYGLETNLITIKKMGTVKGFHFQKFPSKEHKFITCLSGGVFDVSINITRESSNYGKKFYFNLDSDSSKTLFIPFGYAHGFQSLQDNTILIYVHTDKYDSTLETKFNPLESKLNINWPLPISSISQSDLQSAIFGEHFYYEM